MTRKTRVPFLALAAVAALAAPVAPAQVPEGILEDLERRQSSDEIAEKLTRGLAISSGDEGGAETAAPAAEPEPEAPRVAATQSAAVPADGPSVQLRINFEFNSDRLTREAQAQLDELATAMRDPRLAESRFRLDGHTDSKGSAGYNQGLSERRARSAERYLVETHGIAPGRLETRGLGESAPLDQRNPQAAINRRVTVTNLGG